MAAIGLGGSGHRSRLSHSPRILCDSSLQSRSYLLFELSLIKDFYTCSDFVTGKQKPLDQV
jgi:hypothetical protein